MFIPFLILFLPIFLTPLWSFGLYDLEIKYQQSQIYMDNAAILAGRSDRDALNQLSKEALHLKSLHQKYHKALACAFIPATAQVCRALAQKLALTIGELTLAIKVSWNLKWSQNTKKLQKTILTGSEKYSLSRTPSIPIVWRLCTICRKPLHWKVDEKKLVTVIKSRVYPDSDIKFSAQKKVRAWTYRLWSHG